MGLIRVNLSSILSISLAIPWYCNPFNVAQIHHKLEPLWCSLSQLQIIFLIGPHHSHNFCFLVATRSPSITWCTSFQLSIITQYTTDLHSRMRMTISRLTPTRRPSVVLAKERVAITGRDEWREKTVKV